MTALGDLNDDGFPEFAIGAPGNDAGGLRAGKVYIILGRPDGWEYGSSLSSATSAYWGEEAGDRAGFSLAGTFGTTVPHNLTGDGASEQSFRFSLLIGAPGEDVAGLDNAGKVYHLYPHAEPLPAEAPWPTFHHDRRHTGRSLLLGPQASAQRWD